MAQKEITLKVNIEGKDIVLTGKQVELLQGNLIGMREELTKLGERTEENGEKFDKLRGDIEALEKVFGETKKEVKETGNEIENQGKKTEESGKKTESYAKQIKEARIQLIALGERTADNAEQYDFLTSRIQELSDKQEDLQFGTKKLDDALAAIPGPIGQAAGAFKVLDDGLKNIKSALGTLQRDFKGTLPTVDGIKKGFSDFGNSIKNFKISDLGKGFKSLMPTLDGVKSGVMGVGKALIATGIGAIAILVGLLTAAFIKLLSTSKPLQDALGRFGTLFETLMDLVKPFVEVIANALVGALDLLAKAIAFVTGTTDEYNKKLADKKATDQAQDNLNKLQRSFEANADKYDEFTQRKMKADLDYQAKVQELREMYKKGEIKTLDELNKLIADFGAKRNREIESADKDRQDDADQKAKEAADKAKAAAEKRKQIEEDYQKRLKAVRDENTLLEITDENEKEKKRLEIQRDGQLAEIKQLQVSDKKKEELRKETIKKFEVLEKQRQDKVIADQKKADEDLLKTIRDGETSRIKNQDERQLKEAENRKEDALKALKDSKASAEQIAAAKLEIEKQFISDKERIEKEAAQRKKQFDTDTYNMELDNRLKQIDMTALTEEQRLLDIQKLNNERIATQAQTQRDLLKQQLDNQEIDQTQYNERVNQINTAANLAKAENDIQTEETIRQTRYNIRQRALDDLISIAGAETNVGRALLVAKQVLAAKELFLEIKRTISLATQASARASVATREGAAQTAKIGFPQNIPMLIAYAAQAAGIIAAIRSAVKNAKSAASGSSGGGEGGGENFSKNYERGGMIKGKRHAQGGTIIEAEDGEAIMTRKAVTMFRPMLSMMNQMGGGTSFNSNVMTRPDAPSVSMPAEEQSPMIMKTYVVSNELTTEAEKQARLKDLSTI
jgi:hypothetical protein